MNHKMNTCSICEQVALCEDDHFPITDRHRGNTTWPLCRACHDLTDRVPLYKWPPNLVWGNVVSLFNKADRDERVILVKLFKIAADADFMVGHHKHSPHGISYEDRVIACVAEHGPMIRTQIVRRTPGGDSRLIKAIDKLIKSGRLRQDEDGFLAVNDATPLLGVIGNDAQ